MTIELFVCSHHKNILINIAKYNDFEEKIILKLNKKQE